VNSLIMGNVLSERLAPVNVCPLNGRRFFYFKRLTSWFGFRSWVPLFRVLVPAGFVAVINRLGALINTELVNYRIEVDGLPDPVAQKIYEVGPGVPINGSFESLYWQYSWFWSMSNRTTGSMYFVQGKMMLDPIVVEQGQTFSLMAWPWWGIAIYGLGGGVMGFFAPRESYLERRKSCRVMRSSN